MIKKYARGFTLIEVLVTSTIFVVIMATVFSGFRGGIFGYRNIDENLDAYQAAGYIFDRLNTDLRNAFAYKDKNEYSYLSGTSKRISFLSLVNSYYGQNISRDFSFVSYESRENSLLRLVRKNLQALNDNPEIEPEEFAQKADITFEYGARTEPGQEIVFKDTWGTDSEDEKKSLPQAVRITMKTIGKTEYSFTRTIYLVLPR